MKEKTIPKPRYNNSLTIKQKEKRDLEYKKSRMQRLIQRKYGPGKPLNEQEEKWVAAYEEYEDLSFKKDFYF